MSWKKLFFSKFGLVCLLVAFSGAGYLLIGEIYQRYLIEKEINLLSEQIIGIEKGNSELSDVIDYFRSTSFQERELRRKLNLQKPGEHVVVLPAEMAATPALDQSPGLEAGKPPAGNWKAWWDHFFKVE